MIQNHGEIHQTVGNMYLGVSVSENEPLTSKELDKYLFAIGYYGGTIEYKIHLKDNRQHYKVCAYKD